jgi:tetratricopeptide (TPR) repeat protein
MPAKERLWVKLAGAIYGDLGVPSPGEGERIANELVERFPDDNGSLYKAAEAYLALEGAQTDPGDKARMRSSAIRALQRVLELDPGHHQAASLAVRLDQASGRGARGPGLAKSALAARETAEAHGLFAQALAFTHQCEEALRHVSEAKARSPDGRWLATHLASSALVACGRLAEAERELVRFLSVIGDRDPRSSLRANLKLISLQTLQGHCAEAQRTAEATIGTAGWYPTTRATLLSCGHDRLSARRAREYVRSLEDGGQRGNHAELAASFGEFEAARGLAHHLRPGSVSELSYLAFVAGHEGRWDDAASIWRKIQARRGGLSIGVPHELAAVLFSMGRPADAIDALADLDSELARVSLGPDGINWSRSVMLRARARERIGDFAGAIADADHLLQVWSTADPDLSLLLEAKAMRERLAAAQAGANLPR